jgi:transcription-repair coupling factor (superfamily II helicase)
LAAATSEEAVDDTMAEWIDRFGPLPAEGRALIEVARLRVEALRIGIAEIVQARGEIRISPIVLRPSQEVRLQRLERRAVVRGEKLYIPAPGVDVTSAVLAFIREMWPEPSPASPAGDAS